MKTKHLVQSVIAGSLLWATGANAATQLLADNVLELPSVTGVDTIFLNQESMEVLTAEIEVNLAEAMRVKFEFDFGNMNVDTLDGLINESGDSTLNSFVAETDRTSEQQDAFDLAAADVQSEINNAQLLSVSGLDDIELSASNTFIAILTGDGVAEGFSFAGSEDQATWVVGLLAAGTYTLDVTSILATGGAGNIQISAVPIPAAAILFGTALAGFAGFSTRRKA